MTETSAKFREKGRRNLPAGGAATPLATRRLSLGLALCALLPGDLLAQPPRGVPAPVSAEDALAQLSELVGTWRDADRPGSPLRIRFYLTAGGTVLVESWEARGQPHSLTLYHRDGPDLIATHYCPQGNQPRLKLTPSGRSLAFAFRDSTDLDAGESHLHDLAFALTDPDRPLRSETYRQGDSEEATILRLTRADPPAPASN